MQVVNAQLNIGALQASWQAFDAIAHLRPIQNESDYDRMVTLMNSLLEATGDDDEHPMSGLLELASELVSRYEQEHHAIEPASPKDALRFLMDARGLKQEDLAAIVAQSCIRANLKLKRQRQRQRLHLVP